MLRGVGLVALAIAYCGWTEKFEVWILLSGMPAILSVAMTRVMAVLFSASAASAVCAWLTPPAGSRAFSGFAAASPSPLTTMWRGGAPPAAALTPLGATHGAPPS